MDTGIIAAISVVFGAALLLGGINWIFFLIRRKLKKSIRERFDGEHIIGATTNANFLGEQSKGGKQIRGNGALVLTEIELFFIRAMPAKEYVIPIKSIKEISIPTSFNGRSVLSELLCVRYAVGEGADAIAWSLKEPEKWKSSIENLMAQDR